MRLQKVLAAAGVASRRASETLIAEGRVRVDGRVVTEMGTRVDPERARIEVDGRRIAAGERYVYLLLNKPAGVVTSARDPQGRTTVLDLVRAPVRVYPVGRLDAETRGLLLLTNHGDLAHRLTHPRHGVPRTYLAEVRGIPAAGTLERLRRGVRLEDGVARPIAVRERGRARGRAHLELVMAEGRKREVRRMLEALGHPVLRLVRTGFGSLTLGRLRPGQVRSLTAEEVGALLSSVGL